VVFRALAIGRECNGRLGQSQGAVCGLVRVWNCSYEIENVEIDTSSGRFVLTSGLF
jgi:hypothetical protein